jgi:hypothetical protein
MLARRAPAAAGRPTHTRRVGSARGDARGAARRPAAPAPAPPRRAAALGGGPMLGGGGAVRLRSASSGARGAVPDPEHAGAHHEADEAGLLVRGPPSPRPAGEGSNGAQPLGELADAGAASGGGGGRLQVMGLDVTPELCAIAMGAFHARGGGVRRGLRAGRGRGRGGASGCRLEPPSLQRPASERRDAPPQPTPGAPAASPHTCTPPPPPVYFVQAILGLSRIALSFYFKDAPRTQHPPSTHPPPTPPPLPPSPLPSVFRPRHPRPQPPRAVVLF